MNKCRYCGHVENPVSSNPEDYCYFVGEFADKLKGIRSPYCYKRQLDQQTKLLRQILVILKRIGDKSGSDCPVCTGGINGWGHTQACHNLQALLPALERVK